MPQLKQPGRDERQNLGGHHHHEPVGQGDEAAVLADVGLAEMIVGADDLIGEAQFTDQFEGRGLGGEKAIGPGLDGAAFHLLRLDDASQAGTRLQQSWRASPPWPGSMRPRVPRCRRR